MGTSNDPNKRGEIELLVLFNGGFDEPFDAGYDGNYLSRSFSTFSREEALILAQSLVKSVTTEEELRSMSFSHYMDGAGR